MPDYACIWILLFRRATTPVFHLCSRIRSWATNLASMILSESRRSQMPGAGFCSSVAPGFSLRYYMLYQFQLQAALLFCPVSPLHSFCLPASPFLPPCSQSRLGEKHLNLVKSRSIQEDLVLPQMYRKVRRISKAGAEWFCGGGWWEDAGRRYREKAHQEFS